VAVTQADREAAADYIRNVEGSAQYAQMISLGERDGHGLVRAFSNHRLTAIEECAKLAEGPAAAWGEYVGGTPERDRIATAIRALKGGGK
jgi:hypothetical protein